MVVTRVLDDKASWNPTEDVPDPQVDPASDYGTVSL